MSRLPQTTARQDQLALASRLRRRGATWTAIGEALRARFGLNARTAMRVAHGWSQTEVADRWSSRWPEDRKTSKNISYWEQWPAPSGHAPSLLVLTKLAELYVCSVADLVADLPDYRSADHPPSQGTADAAVWPDRAPQLEVTPTDQRPPDEWFVDALRSFVRYDVDRPEVVEERRIVSKIDDLAYISTAISVPPAGTEAEPPASVASDLMYGGRLVPDTARGTPLVYRVDLGRQLRRGDRHEYAIRHRFRSRDDLQPHYVCRPFLRCDYFELRIRFAPDALPARIERLAGVVPRSIDDPSVSGSVLVPDQLDEVVVRFERLALGLAYGLRWQWAEG